MTDQPASTRFATPLVILSASIVLVSGLTLAVIDVAQVWKSLLAIGCVAGTFALFSWQPSQNPTELQLKRSRLIFIMNCVLPSSLLVDAILSTTGWASTPAAVLTIPIHLAAFAAVAVALFKLPGDRLHEGAQPRHD